MDRQVPKKKWTEIHKNRLEKVGMSTQRWRHQPSSLQSLQIAFRAYDSNDCVNDDEFGLFYLMAPDRTIATRRLPGRKKDKTLITFLACSNTTGSERFPLLIIGHVQNPRCFNGNSADDLGYTTGIIRIMDELVHFL